MFDLEENIRAWSDRLRGRGKMKEEDVQELESHLRDEIDDLTGAGLAPDEAFIISVKRLGNVNAISGEYSKLGMAAFWKQLLTDRPDRAAVREGRRKLLLAVLLALLAGTAFKLPDFLQLGLSETMILKNAGLCLFPFMGLYFLATKRMSSKYWLSTLGICGLSALIVNLYPSLGAADTAYLTAIHLPLFLWLVVGVAYAGDGWRTCRDRMDFIRFTGELFIYGVLICCGITVLAAFLLMIFSSIGVDLSVFVTNYLAVYGFCAAALVAAYLVEAKKSVVENFAPVLAKIFSPLFLAGLAAFLIVMLVSGKSPYVERDFLIGFDLMLAAVLGLVVYGISARGLHDGPGVSDYINFALIVAALVVDAIALSAILYRLSAFGVSPNKLAALGENVILLVNLGGLAVLYVRFFRKKADFSVLERWQTFYLWVFAAWFAFVAFAFPLIFRFQ